MNIRSTTSQRLKKALSLRDMRQSELAEKTKIGRSAISQYVSGKVTPKQDKIYLLAQALHVDPAWLMGYDVSMEPDDNHRAPQPHQGATSIDHEAETPCTLAARIELLCQENGISIAELEKSIEIKEGSICQWDTVPPSVSQLAISAKVLRTSMDFLMGLQSSHNDLGLTSRALDSLRYCAQEGFNLSPMLESKEFIYLAMGIDSLAFTEFEQVIPLLKSVPSFNHSHPSIKKFEDFIQKAGYDEIVRQALLKTFKDIVQEISDTYYDLHDYKTIK